MGNTVLNRLVGAFLLLYGIAALAIAWEAHSATSQAFGSLRTFTTAFERERDAASGALQSAAGLLGGRDTSSTGASGSTIPAAGQGTQGLRGRLRGLLGGTSPSAASQPPSGQPSAGQQPSGGQSSDSLGMLDELEGRLSQANGSLSRLAEGPIQKGLLDRVERAENAVLIWLAAHGVVCSVIGLVLLFRSATRTPEYAAPSY